MAQDSAHTPSRRARKWWPHVKWLLLPIVALLCALGVNSMFGIRQLDVEFDATSISLDGVETWQVGHGDEPTVGKAFLEHIDRIDVFEAGGKTPSKSWRKTEKEPIFPSISFSPAPEMSCTKARIEMSRAHDSDATVVSLHITHDRLGPCTLLMKAGPDTLPLREGARLDFLPVASPQAATSFSRIGNVTTTLLLNNVHHQRLKAAMEGEIRGLDAGYTCTRGERLDLSGIGLEVVSIRLDLTDPQAKLKVWARANLVRRFDLDGAHCALGLYHPQGPKALTAWAVLLVFLGLGWRLLRSKEKKNDLKS